MTTQRLFIYGTLAPGRANHHVMADIPGTWQPATLRGRLIDEGWGAAMGCPAIVPTPDGDEVAGFVFASSELDDHWARLDAFEGEGYERLTVTVRVEGDDEVEAYVYALSRVSRSAGGR
ncbi:MAG: gamma-glutamylcyclotransferase family protein [Acidobacteriota bacterium]